MNTIRDAAKGLLPYIGIRTLSTADNSQSENLPVLKQEDAEVVIRACNGALEDIWTLGPGNLSIVPIATALRPPTTVSLTVTNFSRTISALTTYADWMPGCTIRLAGDDMDNQLLSATQLLRPFMGASATGVQATVYADSIPLFGTTEMEGIEGRVMRVIEPVYLPNVNPLRLVDTLEEFQIIGAVHRYGNPTQAASYGTSRVKTVGEPSVAFSDSRYSPTVGYGRVYLRLNPMPGQAYPITFSVQVEAPSFTTAAIGLDLSDATAAGTPAVSGAIIPMTWRDGVFFDIALYRFRNHPRFTASPEANRQIEANHEGALMKLKGMRPAIATAQAHYARQIPDFSFRR